MLSMAPLLQELDGILADKAHPVTARWLCYQHGVGVAEAQNALAKCAESSTSKVAVTYLLTGVDKASGQRVVRLATSEHLEDRKAELAPENVHVQVYAVAPVRQPADAQGMHSRALEQARTLMAKVLSGDAEKHATTFASNGASAVHCTECVRRKDDRPPEHQENVPVATSATSKQPRAKSANTAPASRPPLAPQGTARAASANAAPVTIKQGAGSARTSGEVSDAAPQPERMASDEAAPAAKPASKAAAKGKAGAGGIASAFSKAPPKGAAKRGKHAAAEAQPAEHSEATSAQKARAKAAPAKDADLAAGGAEEGAAAAQARPAAKAAGRRKPQVLDDSDDDFEAAHTAGAPQQPTTAARGSTDSESPLPTKPPLRRRVVLAESDSDEDDAGAPAPAAAAPPGKPVQGGQGAGTPEVPSKRRSSEPAPTAAASKKAKPGSQAMQPASKKAAAGRGSKPAASPRNSKAKQPPAQSTGEAGSISQLDGGDDGAAAMDVDEYPQQEEHIHDPLATQEDAPAATAGEGSADAAAAAGATPTTQHGAAAAAAQQQQQSKEQQQSKAHAEYGEPPDPDAEIEMQGGKAFWVWVTDSGEEKSVPAASAKQACAPALKKPAASQKAEASAQKRKNNDPLASPEEEGPAKKPAAKGSAAAASKKAKSGKAATKKAGFGDLRNMFGKK